jgi:peptidoglycan/LPS O-acetylase OafA/YrhL
MKRPIIESFEGLRGVAALLVVLYHVDALHTISIVKAGYLSVDLFFVLSGFVMCTSYGNRLTSVKEFFDFISARVARLAPLLFFSYVLYFVVANLTGPSSRTVLPTALDVLATISMSFGIGLPHVRIFNFASWSISTEFYTYVLFGVLWIKLNDKHRTTCAVFLVAIATVVLFVIDFSLNHCGSNSKACLDNVSSGGAMVRCLLGFFGGTLACQASKSEVTKRSLSRTTPSVLLGISAISLIVLSTRYGFIAFLLPVVFALLVISVSSDAGPVALVLRTAVPQWLGRLSYSVYLLHMPLLLIFESRLNSTSGSLFTSWLVAFLAALILCAELTHRLIETPGRGALLDIYRRFSDKDHATSTKQEHAGDSELGSTRV